tara:strand:- start:218 stop:487 length:270 start_codon:yes stop_codon:yes gene_type:complete
MSVLERRHYMVVTNVQKNLKPAKISPEVFAKAIQSLDLSTISDPEKRQRAIIERVFKIMAEEMKDPKERHKLKEELKKLEYYKKQLGIS